MQQIRANKYWSVVIIFSCAIISANGCTSEPYPGQPLDGTAHDFDIYWPPITPESKSISGRIPLLSGNISFKELRTTGQSGSLEIVVTITRPSDEASREFWNSQLAFSDVPWMDQVRVWDSESLWQWPNLPYLLRRHGQERIERYGGVDPGRLVDNDFAAVLIRSYDVRGKTESSATLKSPLVSAEWRGNIEGNHDIHTLVHVARSDRFKVQLGTTDEKKSGMLKLWVIYADFLGSRPSTKWPRESEWAGGILTYCEIVWEKTPGQLCRGSVAFLTPPTATGFDWEKWSNDPSAPAQSRLTDVPM